jgi:hypothetical protein
LNPITVYQLFFNRRDAEGAENIEKLLIYSLGAGRE